MPRLTAGHNIFLSFQGASEIIPLHNLFTHFRQTLIVKNDRMFLCPVLGNVLLAFLMLLMGIFLFGCSPKYLGPERVDGGVRFSIKAGNAKKVAIVGNFNQWDAEKDVLSGPDSDGMWKITIPIPEGRYEYLFLINGEEWVLDPTVPFMDDGLGGKNSVVSIKR